MVMLSAGEKKAINGIIIILCASIWRRDKVVTNMEQRRKRFVCIVCQSKAASVASGSSMKGPKREQSMRSHFEPIMLPLGERKGLHQWFRQSGDGSGGKGGQWRQSEA